MFIVVLTVLETACHNKSTSGHSTALAIGLSFVVVILAFGGVSSGSFNPARSLGPALVSGNLKNLWVFILGPMLGAPCACMHVICASEESIVPSSSAFVCLS